MQKDPGWRERHPGSNEKIYILFFPKITPFTISSIGKFLGFITYFTITCSGTGPCRAFNNLHYGAYNQFNILSFGFQIILSHNLLLFI